MFTFIRKAIIVFSLLLATAFSLSANATLIVDPTNPEKRWEIAVITGKFTDNFDLLMSQPWMCPLNAGSPEYETCSDIAQAFAIALHEAGVPGPGMVGPAFAWNYYEEPGNPNDYDLNVWAYHDPIGCINDEPGACYEWGRGFVQTRDHIDDYAVATRVPEPGTIGLLGAGLLVLGFVRKYKRQTI